jgi:hypothetical protein
MSKPDPSLTSLEMYFAAQKRVRDAERRLAADPDNRTLALLVNLERSEAAFHKSRARGGYPDADEPSKRPSGAA